MNVPLFILIIVVYAAISAFGLYLIKDAQTLLSSRALVGAVFYGSGFCIWIVILRLFPLSLAFPVAAGSLIVATHFIGRFFLAESTSNLQLSGIAMIAVGILFVVVKMQ